jgi:hypothetical protein
VTPEVTPGVTPAVTPEVALSVTPEVLSFLEDSTFGSSSLAAVCLEASGAGGSFPLSGFFLGSGADLAGG